ncbi:unnamed protein product [Amoebophrya sp. A25]|nr:unnamed protein product [Amoebophrya sp. A25]|eukprot:GSA25T00025812001.1
MAGFSPSMFLFGNMIAGGAAVLFRNYMDSVESNCQYYMQVGKGWQGQLANGRREIVQFSLMQQWNTALLVLHKTLWM